MTELLGFTSGSNGTAGLGLSARARLWLLRSGQFKPVGPVIFPIADRYPDSDRPRLDGFSEDFIFQPFSAL
jgi:hypothetical protein